METPKNYIPKIGEIKRGHELGYVDTHKKIWIPCVDCGGARWVTVRMGKPESLRCRKCRSKCFSIKYIGEKSSWWKGGKKKDSDGYIQVKIYSSDFFYPMAKSGGYIKEHRLVMAKHLGRCLHRWEIVHHRNHIRDDNRIENLQLVTDTRHNQITILENEILSLKKRVTLLEAENILLRETQGVLR